ncbi:MAG: hypothetical protein KDG54_03960 [Geminicoccaceae bacterium]|nr:hypothetical protein [Geminicoccaceae bacterium]
MAGKIEGKRRFDKRGSAMFARAAMLGEPHVIIEETGTSPVVKGAIVVLCLLVAILSAVLGYGYFEYERGTARQQQLTMELQARREDAPSPELDAARAEVVRLQAVIDSNVAAGDAAAESANGNAAALSSELAAAQAQLEQLRSEHASELALRQAAEARAKALESELSLPQGESVTGDGDGDLSAELEAARLELRLAASERDAARQQVDKLLGRVSELEAVVVKAPAPAQESTDENAADSAEVARLQAIVTDLESQIDEGIASVSGNDVALKMAELRRQLQAQTIELAARDRELDASRGDIADLTKQLAGNQANADELQAARQKLEEADTAVKDAEARRQALENQVAETRSELDGVKAQMLELGGDGEKKFAALQAEFDSYKQAAEGEKQRLMSERDAVERGRSALDLELVEQKNALAETQGKVSSLQSELEQVQQKGSESLSATLAQLDDLKSGAEAERQSLVQERDSALSERDRMKAEVDSLREQSSAAREAAAGDLDRIERARAALESEVADLRVQNDQLASQNEELKADSASMGEQVASLRQSLDERQSQLDGQQADSATLAELRSEVERLQAENARLGEMASASDRLTQENAQLASERDDLAAQVGRLGEQVASLQGSLEDRDAQQGEREATAAALAALKNENASLMEERQRLDTMLAGYETAREGDVDQLRRQLAELEANASEEREVATGLDAKLAAALDQVRALEADKVKWENERVVLAAERDAFAAKMAEQSGAAGDATSVNSEAEVALQMAEERIGSLQTRLDQITEERDAALATGQSALVAAERSFASERERLQERIANLEKGASGDDTAGVTAPETAENANGVVVSNDRILALTQQLTGAKARIADLEGQLANLPPAAPGSINVASELHASQNENDELTDRVDQLRDRMNSIQKLLSRYTPKPPEPAPR